jgi:uncharacterized protein
LSIEKLTLDQARRVALAAQGFAEPRPKGRVDRRHIRKVLDRIGVLQVDSVNVLCRSEELPIFARLGPHDRSLVRTMEQDREVFEYWSHEASLLPVGHEPLFRWKKSNALAGDDPTVWGGIRNLHIHKKELVDQVYSEIEARGPVAASQLSMKGGKKRDGWGWHWDDAKVAVENLFWTGRIVAAGRTSSFEREYDIPDRVLPAHVVGTPDLGETVARKELLLIAARAHGVGTAKCLADYHRQNIVSSRSLIAELVEEGRLHTVSVPGWKDVAYIEPSTRIPRRVNARALLSPFDSLIWERTRTEQLFGFRYRIEIYVPQEKRVHGYYVLPFLLGDQLVARVDLKADRKASVLLVQASWGELGIDETEVAHELAEELRLMATWLGLERVSVQPKGDLHRALKKAIT